MNWREVGIDGKPASIAECRTQIDNDPKCRDHFYDFPNLDLMPGLASPSNEWFNYIKEMNLKTYATLLSREYLPLCAWMARSVVYSDDVFFLRSFVVPAMSLFRLMVQLTRDPVTGAVFLDSFAALFPLALDTV